ncbi:MAG: hypothetical protein RBS57_05855 [Desulforhabdus sp.]|nr:hypothetical protein [Desulforhabdus sp.]
MEYNPKDFFLIVANNPLPDNTGKYIEAMVNAVPDKIGPNDYFTWLRYGFERRLGRQRIKGFIYPLLETKVYEPFTDDDFKSFERNREMLIGVLNEIVDGRSFSSMRDLSKIIRFADSMQSREVFGIPIGRSKCVLERTKYHPRVTDDTDELEGIFALACYGLGSFLANDKQGGRDRIKKCEQCNHFFSQKRKDPRNRFCSDVCRKQYHDLERKTATGRAGRAEYMVEHRKTSKCRRLKEKREEELKRIMDSGYTRSQAEEFLDDPDT